jgi:selenocysteine lyase/cysteine desulfurase
MPRRFDVSRRDLLAALGAAPTVPLLGNVATAQPSLPDSSRKLWEWVRTQQVLDPQLAWLDTARVGPTLRSVLVNEYRAREALNTDFIAYSNDAMRPEVVRRSVGHLADFVGADANEIAFTSGASGALRAAIHGLALEAGDEVITTAHEHPCVARAWDWRTQHDGLVIKRVSLPMPLAAPEDALGLLAGAVTDRTRVISCAHVQYTDGALLPIREICAFARQRDITTIIDGAQAVGMIDVALHDLGCDCYGGSLHKWINATYGTGFLYVRSDLQERVEPIEANPAATQPDWPDAMRRYGQVYHYYSPLFQPIESLLAMHAQIGIDRIEARIRELAIYARLRLQALAGIELLTPARPGLWAGILTLRASAPSAQALAAALAAQDRVSVGVVPDPSGSGELLRVSTHVFNTHDDIERLVRGLQRRIRV